MFIGNKNIITNIYRIQENGLILCGYFCIGFIDFMLEGRSLLDYTSLISFNEYKQNDTVILKYAQSIKRLKWEKKRILSFAACTGNLKILKYHTFLKKH